jgi:hypothetical protein
MNVQTEELIGRLAADARPVHPLPAPWARALMWLALSAPPVFAVVWWHGLGGKAGMVTQGDPRMVVEWIAILATAISAAFAAFASAVPGMSRRWLWVPLLPLVVWLAAAGQGCVEDYRVMGAAAFTLRWDTDCYVPTVLAGIIPVVAMLAMLRRAAPMTPHVTLALGALAIAAVVNLAMLLFHVGDVSIMVLFWHVGVVAVVAAVAGLAGALVLRWPRVA